MQSLTELLTIALFVRNDWQAQKVNFMQQRVPGEKGLCPFFQDVQVVHKLDQLQRERFVVSVIL